MSFSTFRIGIVGLGQIGGSIATRLSAMKQPPTIFGYDLRPELQIAAQERRIVTEIAKSETELIDASDVVLIAVPMGEILAFLKRQHVGLKQKITVTDTGSLKKEVMRLSSELGLTNFVGGHPLAGTERRGVDSWDGTLFNNANYFLTSDSTTNKVAVELVSELVTNLGAKAIPVDPERQDQIFAITSNLPHVIAYSVTEVFAAIPEGNPDKNLFLGTSFLGATRVAGSDPEMVFQLLWHNRANLSGGLASLLQRLTIAKSALDENDEELFRQVVGVSIKQ